MSLQKKSILGIAGLIVVLFVVALIGKEELSVSKYYRVKKNNFELNITSKGEIQGKNDLLITLPDIFKRRELRIYELKLKDIVDEGTQVTKGQWVATLDNAAISQKIQSNRDDMERRLAELNDAKIDTTIQLTKLREELEEFNYDLQYKALDLEQAKYESPAYQRKTQVDYNKTVRQMIKKQRDYELKKIELKVKTRRIENHYIEYYKKDSLLKRAMMATRITAPQDGMVMYAKLWGGRKIKAGDNINIWDATIATLPDMSVPVSETFIKEIDINKIALGDSVYMAIDALPNKIFTGFVSKIANIGQELPGFDSKVFRVLIELNKTTAKLKPAMTTNNTIVVANFKDVISIPRQYIFTQNGKNFVYLKKNGHLWKKEVTSGADNEKSVLIKDGLNENDEILITQPKETDKIPFYKQ
ncbi:MAG: efflux RND transporter periplasmic adaptor subunit [Prolixibacteraceae bacterium]|nr:efflux RND transporter periplasmic adaptor subunit [Prolixibacteraceae bacterium]